MKKRFNRFAITIFISLSCLFLSNFYRIKANKKNIQIPAAIVFAIVDLKYDGQNFKICEFGDGLYSNFSGGGFGKLYGQDYMWLEFLKYLKPFNLPIYYMDTSRRHLNHQDIITDKSMLLFNYNDFISSDKIKTEKDISKISNYNSIVVEKNRRIKKYRSPKPFDDFLQSGAIILNKETESYFNNKLLTSLIFDCEELREFRPKFLIFEQTHTNLSEKKIQEFENLIKDKIGSKYYVLKPIDQFCGRGIIIFHKSEIANILKNRLGKITKNKKKTGDSSYDYWITRKNNSNFFIIEEFFPSKKITVENEEYDPTMRVMFTIKVDDNKFDVDFLGSYWKLPSTSLNEKGTFNAKHKSKIKNGKTCAAKTSPEDFENVTKALKEILPMVYLKILNLDVLRNDFDKLLSVNVPASKKRLRNYILSKIN